MSNKFDDYNENDEITLSSSSNSNKTELQKENSKLKQELTEAYLKINDYEEVIKNTSVKNIGNDSNLSNDDLINIMSNSSVLINKYNK